MAVGMGFPLGSWFLSAYCSIGLAGLQSMVFKYYQFGFSSSGMLLAILRMWGSSLLGSVDWHLTLPVLILPNTIELYCTLHVMSPYPHRT